MTDHGPDKFTLLCTQCGYIIENLYADANCPECGYPVKNSLTTDREGTPWQRRPQSMIALVKTWILTIWKPSKVISIMKFDEANGKSMTSHTPFLAVVLAVLALLPMAFPVGIGGTLFTMLVVGLVGLLFWGLAAIYFRICFMRLHRSVRKMNNKIDTPMAWSIIGHASSYLILIPASHALVIWLALFDSFAVEAGWVYQGTTLSRIFGLIYIAIFFGSIPASLSLSEIFIARASRKLRYINHTMRPLFSSDTQQLLAAESSDQP